MHALGLNGAVVLCIVSVLWLVSVRLRNVSIVDPFWSMLFLAVTWTSLAATQISPVKLWLCTLVSLWALRLFVHLLLRLRGKPEDPRYAAFRQRFGAERYWWFSFFQVFLLQGALAFVIAAPLQLRMLSDAPVSFGLREIASTLLFAVGFAFEAVADAQLQAFRNDPTKKGQVLDTGLFRYSRHPNYFGEALIAWAFWLAALSVPWGVATIFAPMLMTFLLLRVSGVTMLDEHLVRTRPGYAAYIARTSGFFPRPPRPAPPASRQ